MRIVFLHQFNMFTGWGGSASMLRALHRSLLAMGHHVDVVAPSPPTRGAWVTHAAPYPHVLTFGPEKREGETAIDELSEVELREMAAATAETIAREVFRDGRPELLVANHISIMALACQSLGARFGIPYRLISYGTDTQLLLREQKYRDLFGPAAREADRIFTISGFVGKEVRETVGGRVEVMGGGVDAGLFHPGALPASRERPLLYFGRLVSEKGIWVLLKALQQQTSGRELWMAGEGPLRAEIEEFLPRMHAGRTVRLLGYVPQAELRDVLLQASAVVVPSIWQEPLGLVVLEALACGLPVIATSVGGIPEMIIDGEHGFLVRENDPAALAAAIDRLLGDEATYTRIRDTVRRSRVPVYDDLARQLIAGL